MGTISTSTGLISGLDIQGIVDQLIAIQSRPRQLVEQRVGILQSQKAAFLDLNAQLLALETAAKSLGDPGLFRTKAATTSNESIATVTASKNAAEGTYSFTVDQLVSTQQLITGGFADSDTTTFGATTLRFESDRARLDADTSLAQLNGGAGIDRGEVRITDRSGASATIDLTRAITINDVLDQINDNLDISVSAALTDDGITLTDNTGQTTSDLIVQQIGSTDTTAADLGLLGSVAANTLTGTQINTLTAATQLVNINDGNGVRIEGTGQDDFSITDDSGTYNVSLFGSTTIDDVIETIETATSGAVTAAIAADGVSLELTGTGAITVATLNDSGAAADLGILGSGTGTLAGERVLADLGSRLLKSINGGVGLELSGTATLTQNTSLSSLLAGAGVTGNADEALADISVQDRAGNTYTIEVDGLNTVGDLIDAFDDATDGAATLGISGSSLVARTSSAGSFNFQITDANGATIATDLGITADLAPGAGDSVTGAALDPSTATTFSITDRSGASALIDLTGATSVTDVIDAINAAGIGVTASLNNAGNGLAITDTTGSIASNLIIDENGGSTAGQLGLLTGAIGVEADRVDGVDTDLRFISEATQLATLNGGKGVAAGKFTLRDSDGLTAEVDLTQGETTLAQVIDEINSRPTSITATINATGDGITLTDGGSGTVAMRVTEAGSSTAKDLGILQEDTDADGVITGSFERTVEIEATDTLEDIVEKINEAGVGVAASLINDGSGVSPYRLSLVSDRSGVEGRFIFDDGGLGLGASQLVQGRDAVVLYGSNDPAEAILITSQTNTLSDTVQGLTIDLKGTSDQPVQISVTRNDDAAVAAVTSLVEGFNGVLDTIDKYDKYDAETEQRGLLLGDSTIGTIRNRLFSIVNNRVAGVGGQYEFLTQVGLTVRDGARLRLDEEKLRDTLATDNDAVRLLFSATTSVASPVSDIELPPGVTIPDPVADSGIEAVGFGLVFQELLKGITDSVSGTLTLKTDTIDSQIERSNDRIEQLNTMLASRRARLEREFAAMEQALARLQDQSGALAGLQNLANNAGNQGG